MRGHSAAAERKPGGVIRYVTTVLSGVVTAGPTYENQRC